MSRTPRPRSRRASSWVSLSRRTRKTRSRTTECATARAAGWPRAGASAKVAASPGGPEHRGWAFRFGGAQKARRGKFGDAFSQIDLQCTALTLQAEPLDRTVVFLIQQKIPGLSDSPPCHGPAPHLWPHPDNQPSRASVIYIPKVPCFPISQLQPQSCP